MFPWLREWLSNDVIHSKQFSFVSKYFVLHADQMTKHLEFQPVGCGASEDCKLMIPAGMPALVPMISDTGTRCPMTVVAPMLTVMKVSECTKVCGMQNKLDVVLEANVAMMAKNSITIGGFMAADGCMFMYLYVLDSM